MDALVAHVTFDPDGNRLQLPKHLSDRLVWLTGSETIAAWIWAVSPGRYRLLSDEQVQLYPALHHCGNCLPGRAPVSVLDRAQTRSL